MDFFGKKQLITNGIIYAEYKKISESIPTHIHDVFEIEYIIRGTGTYIVDGEEYEIQDNMLFYMSPASFHSFKNLDAEIINILFPCDICDSSSLFRLFFSKKSSVYMDDTSTLVGTLLGRIVTCCKNNDITIAISFLQCLLYELSSLVSIPDKRVNSYVQSAILYMTENFRNDITLNDTSNYVGIVPPYLSKLFSEEIGMSYKTYLDNLRFGYATKLLAFSNTSIADICRQSGFKDYVNFTRRFKERYDLTPTEYREKHYDFF